MNTNPLVTVYIPCRNYGNFLEQCVESVLSQAYSNWELFIIDEASTDNTADICNELRRKHPDRITIIKNAEATGLQKIANKVLALANGKYMIRLDADDWLDENALLVMIAKLESSPGCGLVYGNYFYTDPNGKVLGIERRPKLGTEDNAGHLPPHGACTMFRTRALKAVGGYSEDIDAQDGWELWYKLYKRVGAVSLDIPVFYYRQHGNSLSRDSNRLLKARSRIFERISASLEGNYKPSCMAVIPVRESYPGFDGVPYRNYEGISLLERALLSATQAQKITHVIVSSQSETVLDYAAELEREGRVPKHIRVLRRELPENAGYVPIQQILIDAGEQLSKLTGHTPDIAMFLSLHAVCRRPEHIDKAINVLRITESDSVVSVQEEREPIFSHGSDGLQLLNPGRFQELSYDRERLYRFNGALIGVWWDILRGDMLLGENVSYVEMSLEDSLQIKSSSLVKTL